MFVTTLIFSAAALPAGEGVVTALLENVANAPADLVSIRTVDEVRVACVGG